jgi:hypothetical protein
MPSVLCATKEVFDTQASLSRKYLAKSNQTAEILTSMEELENILVAQ